MWFYRPWISWLWIQMIVVIAALLETCYWSILSSWQESQERSMETRDVWLEASILPPTRGPASSLFLLQGQHTPFPLPEVLLLPSVNNRFSSHPLASVVKPLPHRTSSPGRLHLQKGLHSEGLSPESFLSDTLIQKSVLLMNSSSSEKASAQDRSLFKKISREERPP